MSVHEAAISIREETRDGPVGQENSSLIGMLSEEVVGRIDYSVYQGEPAIAMISVETKFRRSRVATRLLHCLQAKYPQTEIAWGMMTEEGHALYSALPKQFVINQQFEDARTQLESVRAKLDDYSKLSAEYQALLSPSPAQRAAYYAAIADWNDLHDLSDELVQFLASSRPGTNLLLLP